MGVGVWEPKTSPCGNASDEGAGVGPARVAADGELNDGPDVEGEPCSKVAPWGAEGRPAIKASIAAALKKGSMAAAAESSDSSVEDEEAADVEAVESDFNGVGAAVDRGSFDAPESAESAESEALEESDSLEPWARRSVALAAAAREATERSIHWAKESWPSWLAGAREEAEKSGAPAEGVEMVAWSMMKPS
jgi:hypothetical protein